MKRQRNKGGLIATLLLVGVLGTSAYAFTASNDLTALGAAGDGHATVSGFIVTNIHFSIPDLVTDPTTVTFHLDKAATTVKASGSAGDALVTCTPGVGANNWTCDLAESLTAADDLRVAATA